jgi:hypothetical protein
VTGSEREREVDGAGGMGWRGWRGRRNFRIKRREYCGIK